jgi:peptidoglycan pentaglycine glycine transferase (the first glycine)
MELRILHDRDAWDDLVLEFPNADLRQSHAWGETRRRQGWSVIRLGAFDGGRRVAALAVYARSVPGLGGIAYAPRGPAMDFADDAAWAALPVLVRAAAEVSRVAFVRVSPPVPAERADVGRRLADCGFTPVPDLWTVWNTPRNVMRLSLAGSERDLLGAMARKRRQHISTAPKKGLTVEWRDDLDAVRQFYATLVEHSRRQGYPIRDWGYFEALQSAFGPAGQLGLAIGRVREELASALLGVRYGSVAYPLYAPSTSAARDTAIGDLLHWEWIRWAKAAGCEEVDFGSSGTYVPPRGNEPTYGIYRFKTELGCRLELSLPYHDYVLAPSRHWFARAVEQSIMPRAHRWLRRLPPAVGSLLLRRAA